MLLQLTRRAPFLCRRTMAAWGTTATSPFAQVRFESNKAYVPDESTHRIVNNLLEKGLSSKDPDCFVDALQLLKGRLSTPESRRLQRKILTAHATLLFFSGQFKAAAALYEPVYSATSFNAKSELYNFDANAGANDMALIEMFLGNYDRASAVLTENIRELYTKLDSHNKISNSVDRAVEVIPHAHGIIRNTLHHRLLENERHSERLETQLQIPLDAEFLNYFYSITMNHLAMVAKAQKDYKQALDWIEEAYYVSNLHKRYTVLDPSAAHIHAATLINYGSIWRTYDKRESNEIGEAMVRRALVLLDKISPNLQFGMLHVAAYVNMAIYLLLDPTPSRVKEARKFTQKAMNIASDLPGVHNVLRIPPLVLKGILANSELEAESHFSAASYILNRQHVNFPVQSVLPFQLAIGHNIQVLQPDKDQLEDHSEFEGFFEPIPFGAPGSEEQARKFFGAMDQCAFTFGTCIDGGLFNLPQQDKDTRVANSRWIFTASEVFTMQPEDS